MAKPNRLPQYEVRNDGEGPYAVFQCERCAKKYSSQPILSGGDSDSRGAGGLFRKALGCGRSDPRTARGLNQAQLETAWAQVAAKFELCPECGKIVCKSDFNSDRGACTTCKPAQPAASTAGEKKKSAAPAQPAPAGEKKKIAPVALSKKKSPDAAPASSTGLKKRSVAAATSENPGIKTKKKVAAVKKTAPPEPAKKKTLHAAETEAAPMKKKSTPANAPAQAAVKKKTTAAEAPATAPTKKKVVPATAVKKKTSEPEKSAPAVKKSLKAAPEGVKKSPTEVKTKKTAPEVKKTAEKTPAPGAVKKATPSGKTFTAKNSKLYDIYFTAPGNGASGGIDSQLAPAIAKAKTSIDVAAFELDLETVADALAQAAGRGVRVRVVTDSDYIGEDAIKKVKKAKIKVMEDKRQAFMHNKFVVIDGKEVWMGSWNLTFNCTYRNNNNAVVMRSKELAQNYTTEFEEMFKGKFGGGDSATPNPKIQLGDVIVENFFAPEDKVLSHLLPYVQSAKKSIYFLAFSFTEDKLGSLFVQKKKAGLKVQGVIETRNATGSGSEFEVLKKGGVDVLPDGNPYVMHNKVIILDEKVVITGSYNFSSSAESSNDENVAILTSPEIAAVYLEEYRRIYQTAKDAQGK